MRLLPIIVLSLLLLVGCAKSEITGDNNVSEPQTPLAKKQGELAAWQPEGIISSGEYISHQKFGAVDVYSRVEADTLYMAISAKTEGYVAIGFDQEYAMRNADILIGYVVGKNVVLEDHFSENGTGPHLLDTTTGGSNDILSYGGHEENGITTIEFSRKLNTGNHRDKVLKPGENKIIWAIGDKDDITKRHRGQGQGSGVLLLP